MGVKVVNISLGSDGACVTELSDGTFNVAECCNCNSFQLSKIFLHLNPKTITPPLPDGIDSKRLRNRSCDDDEYVNGVCWDEDCIGFSTASITLRVPVTSLLPETTYPFLGTFIIFSVIALTLFWFLQQFSVPLQN